MDTYEKIDSILNHIQNVQKNCYKLGIKLIKMGEVELGRMLISNGQIHDNSKFSGIEFEHLFSGDPLLKDVVKHHASTNPHHVEFWGNIKSMPKVFLAEMVCDMVSRSSEFGTDVRVWITETATKRYDFEVNDFVGEQLFFFLDLLLEKPFNNANESI